MYACKVSQLQLRKMRQFLLLVGPALAADNPDALRLLEEIAADCRIEDEADAAYAARAIPTDDLAVVLPDGTKFI